MSKRPDRNWRRSVPEGEHVATARRLATGVTLGLFLLLVGACGKPPAQESAFDVYAEEPDPFDTRGTASGADVVLITVDTLRADHLGFYGNTEARTPAFDRLAEEGRVFTRAYAHSAVTLPSHVNLLTGRYPYEHGVRENSGFVLGDDLPILAEILGQASYATGAFVGAFPLDSRYGLDRGFDVYDDSYPLSTKANDFWIAERNGAEVVSAALEWWHETQGRPRFLWVHLYDPHTPYEPPEEQRRLFPNNPYLGEIAATDSYLKPLLDELREQRDRPVLTVFTSDHGEGLGEHGEISHGLFAYEATLHVPLVLQGAGVPTGVDNRLVGHVDVVPTILELLGLEAPDGLPGTSLLGPKTADRRLYFEAVSSYFNRGWAPLRGLLEGSWKMISLPLPELYDLEKDAAEEVNLAAEEKSAYRRLHARLPDEDWPPGTRVVDPEEARQLRQLGYLTSSASSKTSFTEADDPKSLIDLDGRIWQYMAAYGNRDFGLAAEIGRQIVAERPQMAVGHEYLAIALLDLGQAAEAVAVLEAAVQSGLESQALRRQLGLTLSELGRAGEALTLLRPMAADGDAATLNALGVALTDSGQHEAAIAQLQRALEMDPASTKALQTLGVAELRLQRPREARAHLERALELDQNLPLAWNILGVALSMQGDPAGAVQAWQRAVALDPNLLDALFNLGMTAAQIGRYDIARRALADYLDTASPERFAGERAQVQQVLNRIGGA